MNGWMDEWLKFKAAYEGWTHVSYGTFLLMGLC